MFKEIKNDYLGIVWEDENGRRVQASPTRNQKYWTVETYGGGEPYKMVGTRCTWNEVQKALER